MSRTLFPGIRYDPREPPPPGLDLGHSNVAYFAQGGRSTLESKAPPPRRRHDCIPALPMRPRVARVPEVKNYANEPQEGFLSPLSTSVKTQIIHDTAKFTITQSFGNQSHEINQGVYQFPLPFDTTVTDFNCRIGPNKVVRGEVKAREEARHEFDNARRRGRTGGLMEQQTAEIFTITLANIPSRTKVQAELSFMFLLKHSAMGDHQVFTMTLPTFIAPRYGDAPPGIRMLPRDSHSLSLNVDVLTAEDILSVKSETHAIKYERGTGPKPCQTWDDFVTGHDDDAPNPKAAAIELEDRLTSLDKDLVITIETALGDNMEAPQVCLEKHPTIVNHQALMLTLPPSLMSAAADTLHDGEIIFLADRSGSMDDKIDNLKSAMMFFINGIPRNQPFNIWCFGSDYESLWPQSRRLDEATRQEAMAYVHDQFNSDMGGTEILPALEQICETGGNYGTMDVIVLTDGEVWHAEETIDFVKSTRGASNGRARFFSLGIGHAVSHQLVEGIAKSGGGYAEVITSASAGGWEDRVVAVLKATITSHTSSLRMTLEWEGEENQAGPSFKQSPADLSDISLFLRNRAYLMLDDGKQLKSVVLQVQNPDGSVTTKTILPKRLSQPDTFIHKLAARALLRDLERGESWLHRGADADDPVIRAAAIRLGCDWSVVSRWTSFVAVEEETKVSDKEVEMDMEIPEAADELNDALLTRRGGQPSASLTAGLLSLGAEVEDSDGESVSSGSSPGTHDLTPPAALSTARGESNDGYGEQVHGRLGDPSDDYTHGAGSDHDRSDSG